MPKAIGPEEKPELTSREQKQIEYLVRLINHTVQEENRDPVCAPGTVHVSFISNYTQIVQKAVIEHYLEAKWQKAEWPSNCTFKLTR